MWSRARRYAFAAIAVIALVSVSIRVGFTRHRLDPRAMECASETRQESAIKQRLKIHPGCPKAHFAYAQLLAKTRRIEAARRELREAERLQPGLSFAPPGKVSELASTLGMRNEIAHARQFHF